MVCHGYIYVPLKACMLTKRASAQLRGVNSLHGTASLFFPYRAIYDGDEHEKFLEKLDARISDHDREIEKMCNFHYQGFIDCIRELLQVRSKAQKLKVSIPSL